MFVQFMPAGLLGQPCTCPVKAGRLQSAFATDLFLFFGSTGSKQTLNGLFLFTTDLQDSIWFQEQTLPYLSPELFFPPVKRRVERWT
jgi:hypothetical protein